MVRKRQKTQICEIDDVKFVLYLYYLPMSVNEIPLNRSKSSSKLKEPRENSNTTRDYSDLPQYPSIENSTIDDIIDELRRLKDYSRDIKDTINLVNEHAAKTQIDLESLLSRSLNNNKHLQSLLSSAYIIQNLQALLENLDKKHDKIIGSNILDSLIDERITSVVEQHDQKNIDSIRLKDQLESYEDKVGTLNDLDIKIKHKEKILKELQADYQRLSNKLQSRVSEFQLLEKQYNNLNNDLNSYLGSKYKTIQDSITISSANILDQSQNTDISSFSKITKVTNMLRNKYLTEETRRAISLSHIPKSYNMFPPQSKHSNNSDDEP